MGVDNSINEKCASEKVLQEFLSAFRRGIACSDDNSLQKLNIKAERKYFFYDLFRFIGKEQRWIFNKSDQRIEKEFLKVDYTFFQSGPSGWAVPKIFIESENDSDVYWEETQKLCSLNAPLKVLLLYENNDYLEKEFDDYHGDFSYIISDYHNKVGLVGYFLILAYVSQNDENVIFKRKLYNEKGEVLANDKFGIRKEYS